MRVIRKLNRFYVHDLEQAIDFYQDILKNTCCMRLSFTKINLKLAEIGGLLLLETSEENKCLLQNIKATFIVDDIEEYKAYLLAQNCVILKDITVISTIGFNGRNMMVQHIDGTVIEYMQINKYKPTSML